MFASIVAPGPSEAENPNGNESCPSIPVISWVPTFANSIVNGTLLSPLSTSILLSSVPKYASNNFTSPKSLSNAESPKFPDCIGPSFQSANEDETNNGKNPIKNKTVNNFKFIMLLTPLLKKVVHPQMPFHL